MSWLLNGNQPGWPAGQPFGEGSERWRRARDPNSHPWDDDCYVTPLIGGQAAMDEIRNAFESVIKEAETGANCHVYIAGWRFNPNRDMFTRTGSWATPLTEAQKDGTAWGMVRRLMFAGVKVRILLWLPPTKPLNIESLTGFEPHIQAHFYLARLVKAANNVAKAQLGLDTKDENLGVVFLDTRISEAHGLVGSHHQKFIVVRGDNTNVAFCGGVDLAYTRRDAPQLEGDWQSGDTIPSQSRGITNGVRSVTEWELQVKAPTVNHETDLPAYIGDKEMYGTNRQIWHDQHLKLEGQVVKTLEHVFLERWSDPPRKCLVLDDEEDEMPFGGSIISSSAEALELQFLSRWYTVSHNRGSKRNPYFVGYGAIKSDIIEILVDGQPITERWNIEKWGVYFPEGATEKLGKWNGKTLEIRFRRRRPKPLPEPLEVPLSSNTPEKKAKVQIWQTIPYRGRARGAYDGTKWTNLNQHGVIEPLLAPLKETILLPTPPPMPPLPDPPYRVGEFSNIVGFANACQQAGDLIWIFDQYFWSVPYALLLKKQLMEKTGLHLVIVLPSWSDLGEGVKGDTQHDLRWNALSILGDSAISSRVAVYVPWYEGNNRSFGIYCHAKVQLFDNQLLVCGSCNINERSFTVDSEVSAAVQSEVVVQNHYKALWEHFVNSSGSNQPFPTPNFTPGWGGEFFSALSAALAQSGVGFLKQENSHLTASITLPNGIKRTAPETDHKILEPINEPRGLAWEVYGYGARDLSQVVHDIHNYTNALKFYRRQFDLTRQKGSKSSD